MGNNSKKDKAIKVPPAHLKLKFLKVNAIRMKIAKQYLSEKEYSEVLNTAISEIRVVING